MTASYDPTLPTIKDRVRMTIGDRNVAKAIFSDEEIVASVAQYVSTNGQGLYAAAAQLLRSMAAELTRGVKTAKLDILSEEHFDPAALLRQAAEYQKLAGAWGTWEYIEALDPTLPRFPPTRG